MTAGMVSPRREMATVPPHWTEPRSREMLTRVVADVRAVRQAVVPGCAFSARIPSALSAVVLAARHSEVDGSSPSGAGALGPRVGTVVAVVVL